VSDKQIGTIRPGSFLRALIAGRLRHTVVEEVTDQDNVTVRLGGAGNPSSSRAVAVSREPSTKTRGTVFVAP